MPLVQVRADRATRRPYANEGLSDVTATEAGERRGNEATKGTKLERGREGRKCITDF